MGALSAQFNDRKYAGKGGMDEKVFNQQNFEDYLTDAISMWDASVNGRKNRQSYHTDADTIWIPQMLEKHSKKRKRKSKELPADVTEEVPPSRIIPCSHVSE